MSESNLIFEPEGRFLSLRGPYINQLGLQSDLHVQPEYIENRLIRDGEENGHHITVINHLEITSLIPLYDKNKEENDITISKGQHKKLFKKTQKDIHDTIVNQFGSALDWQRPIDLGIGHCADEEANTYYRVIHWPFGQMIREKIGLPKTNFHITVGFSPRDVHIYKGPATLICLRKGEHCSQKQLQKLIDVVEYYFEDKVFIKALYQTCWRHKYIKEFCSLTRIYIFCKFIVLCFRKLFV
ncbi:uncharacterized protein BX663DRAFT_493846 [Cokeromyces recurvatus]|uniref:uncharacterized protein n=1 Tax=Cokeromyces recurvatus TaxID=90255 RepID=UPI002220A81C|nr:uncharacterized protein BX663DRAFT_493846 [Cokeromyces recurvatus]KAI7908334.1 hypothetical protein BX663DRAFT_493846 [Cokeromyces recurvatus]